MLLRTISEVRMMSAQSSPSQPHVVIEMWADLGCPWCYVGKHRLQTAIDQRHDADRFEIVIRSFELDPHAPKEPEKNEEAYLRTHGGAVADLLKAERLMQTAARREGMEYSVDRVRANTFDVHRVIQYAKEQGRGLELFSTAQHRLLTTNLNPYSPDALAGLAQSVGLDTRRVREILASGEYATTVQADREEAKELGATGVPFVAVDRRVGAPGALKVPGYAQLLEQVAGPAPRKEHV